MKMLIIGDANSMWTKTTIEQTVDTSKNEITLITHGNTKYQSWYAEQGIRVLLIPRHNFGKLNSLIAGWQLKQQLKHERFDVMLIHFVDRLAMVIGLYLLPLAKKRVAAFWGSDIFRASKGTVLFFRAALRKFDKINLTTGAMLERFHKDYGHGLDDKITRANFGTEGIVNIQRTRENCDLKRAEFGIPEDKIVVAVGYNGHAGQQHIPVLHMLKNLTEEERFRIHLLFRMTYGGNPEYRASVEEELKTVGCTYSVFKEFLSDEASALLTNMTDIFIHAQLTDALSASMLEHLYAGALVFNPTWIRYIELETEDIFHFQYHSFEELGVMFRKNLMKKHQFALPVDRDKMQLELEKMLSWDHLKEDWQKLYSSDTF